MRKKEETPIKGHSQCARNSLLDVSLNQVLIESKKSNTKVLYIGELRAAMKSYSGCKYQNKALITRILYQTLRWSGQNYDCVHSSKMDKHPHATF